MSKLIIGPFNRVEGDLEVRLDIADDVVENARVVSPLYRGFERILLGKDPRDALIYAPRICGICSVSQSTAAALALADMQNVTAPENGLLASNIILAAENIADHFTHFYMFFMPDFARDIYKDQAWYEDIAKRFKAIKGNASGEILPARAEFLHIVGILAGKWPHTLSIQPGGTTKAIAPQEKYRLSALLFNFRKFLEKTTFGADLEEITSLSSVKQLEKWISGKSPYHSDFCSFFHLASQLELDKLGRAQNRFMSYGSYSEGERKFFQEGVVELNEKNKKLTASPVDISKITEDVSHAWMAADETPRHPSEGVTIPDGEMKQGYTWCKAPRLGGDPVEVGALARQLVNAHPLIIDAVQKTGGNVQNRILARLLEIAVLIPRMQQWVNELQPGEPFRVHGEDQQQASGVGLTEAARGSLGHWLEVKQGKIENYQIIAPTTWNFSPRDIKGIPGPLEQALIGAKVQKGEKDPVSVQHIVRSFDPCMVCTVH